MELLVILATLFLWSADYVDAATRLEVHPVPVEGPHVDPRQHQAPEAAAQAPGA